MDGLWSRRNNNPQNDSSPSGRGSFAKRFGGDSSSHGGKNNPFNSITTPGALVSPSASTAFGLGSGAFASFGSAKTPKTPGNPFEAALGAAAKTPTAEKSAKEGGLGRSATGKTSNASLAGASATGAKGGAPASANSHPLRNGWVFWFRPPISKANGYIEYEKTLHPMATCETVEEFFEIYRHLNRPSTLPLVSDYHMFKKGVRPIWEDEENKKGGKWIVRLKKGVADRYWEDLLLAMIGDQFFEASDEVCGAVLSVRNGEDILSIWTRTDGGRVLKIRETMKRVLSFPPDTKVEWKSHDSSIQQRTAIEDARREKASAQRSSNKQQNRDQNQQADDRKPTTGTT
ncbi:IF4E-domain-containing protein [Coniochaeta ligniaria NRRL 30616]|uniref:IF4E-domain-containing protein n=1 Tax=Coniochaeta ligniaria NRRL 30616 TaxID=1408157 RepID=A0A1J7JKY0_9PEZI|nr:IF4E-domain-containing protein [Coniochaeta ligniaria NRRL 30616]